MNIDYVLAVVFFAVLAFLTFGCINLALGNPEDPLSQFIIKLGKTSLMYTAGGLGMTAVITIFFNLIISTMVLLFLFIVLAVIYATTKGEAY